MAFGLLELLLLTGCVQAVLLAIYLFFHSSIKGGTIFGLVLSLLGIHLFLVVNDRQDFFMRLPHLLHVTWLLPILYGPLILIFVRRITRHSLSTTPAEWLYFAPFAIMVAYHLPFLLQSAAAKRAYIADYALSAEDDFGLINQLVNWLHLIYFGAALWFYNRYQKRILAYAANEEARLLWLGKFLRLIVVIVLIGVIVFYARKYQWPYLGAVYPYHFLGVMFLVYWSAYKLIRQPAIFQSSSEEDAFSEVEESPADTGSGKGITEQHERLAAEMETLMQEDKLYRKAGLTLQDLSVRLNSNKQYVSETINQVFGKNFYDYVNTYRLNEFTERLENGEDQNLTLLGIATNAGFNSKATFNAVFKKHYGVTPSEFQKMKKTARQD